MSYLEIFWIVENNFTGKSDKVIRRHFGYHADSKTLRGIHFQWSIYLVEFVSTQSGSTAIFDCARPAPRFGVSMISEVPSSPQLTLVFSLKYCNSYKGSRFLIIAICEKKIALKICH